MFTRILLPAIALVTLAAAPALASSDDCDVPRGNWMSKDELRSKTEAQGYKVRKIKEDDGCYEVYALNGKGERLELYINPKTGEIVRKKVDD